MVEQQHDKRKHRSLEAAEAPLDSANESLTDALRASFSILKGIMAILVVLFVFSGLSCLEQNQQAVVLRFGKLHDEVRSAGLSMAWPFPIDQTLVIRTNQETLKFNEEHMVHLNDNERSMPFNRIPRYGGLNPRVDGYLLTGDHGVAHASWSVVYEIRDLPNYVANVADQNGEAARTLIGTLLENAAVRTAARMSAKEITQTRTDIMASDVKLLVNQMLEELNTGIWITTIEVPVKTAPIQTLQSFLQVTQAENNKATRVEEAHQQANSMLNESAGAAYAEMLEQIKQLDIAMSNGDAALVGEMQAKIDDLLENVAAGQVGAAVRRAKANYTELVQASRADVEQFQALSAEYKRNPRLLVDRLWQQTERRILGARGVVKYYLPAGQKEVRIQMGPDPRDTREQEIRGYQNQDESPTLGAEGLDLGAPGDQDSTKG